MKYLSIFPYYLGWHYGRAIGEMFVNFKNFLNFVFNFFSIKVLLKTLFSPFQRLQENYSGGLEVGKFLENWGANMIMRGVGFLVRSFFILLGLGAFLLTFVFEILFFLLWLILPAVIIFLFCSSLLSLILMI